MTVEQLLSYWPGWLALAVSTFLIINRLIEESSKFAGYLGSWGRKRHARAAARHHLDLQAAQFGQAITEAIEKARTTWESEENEALRALDLRLETVSGVTQQQKKDIDELRFAVRVLTTYSEYESWWHGQLSRAMAQVGNGHVDISLLPPHIDYWDFEAKFRLNNTWRAWAIPAGR
jgi:hypothetical protein